MFNLLIKEQIVVHFKDNLQELQLGVNGSSFFGNVSEIKNILLLGIYYLNKVIRKRLEGHESHAQVYPTN